jgi:DnaK suppressor protein
MTFNPSGLTESQLKELRKKLSQKLESITDEVKDLELILTNEESDEKGAPDEVDRSSFEEEMQRIQLVLDGKKNLQFEILEAVKRIDDGTYGICEESEEPIGFKRLLAQPWTRFSIEAQQDIESRRKNRATTSSASSYQSYSSDEGGSTED